MGLEGIMISELVRHRNTNTVWYHLYVESKNNWTHRNREQIGGCQGQGSGGGVEELGKGGQKVKLSVIRLIKFWRCNVQHYDYS